MKQQNNGYNYLFGPAPSRRFGRSLGVDLTPYKTCSYDCIFCQLGPTPKTTVERREYLPIHQVLTELDSWVQLDAILATLQRRPCTAKHIAEVFGMHLNEVAKHLGKQVRTGHIHTERKQNHLCYFANHNQNRDQERKGS